MEYPNKVLVFFDSQLGEWRLAKTNFARLGRVVTKTFDFGDFKVMAQFNPDRIRSSAARVDVKSIEARPCFLCRANRPPEQKDFDFEGSYSILVNPFPIFRRHLTIAAKQHIDQRIRDNLPDLLDLASALTGFSVFYNGPQCGASAPDHLHFQAGETGTMPIENDFERGKHLSLAGARSGTELFTWKNYLRGIVTIKGRSKDHIVKIFREFFARIQRVQDIAPEPMLNILASFQKGEWIVHLIPRKAHRPSQFFLEGERQILVSPASVDLAGLIITPREKDFFILDNDIVTDIFKQVCFNETELAALILGCI